MSNKLKEIKLITPYMSFKTFTSFIDRLHSSMTPPIIDKSILQHMSGSGRGQLMSALRFLKLIENDGMVTNRLRDLVSAYKSDDWSKLLRDTLNQSFQHIVSDLDLEAGTDAQLQNAFKARGHVEGHMLNSAVRFYLAFLKEAGIAYSPHFGNRRVTIKSKPRKAKNKKSKGEETVDEFDDIDNGASQSQVARFQVHIPGRSDAKIILPSDINDADWEFVKNMLDAYVERLTKEGQS